MAVLYCATGGYLCISRHSTLASFGAATLSTEPRRCATLARRAFPISMRVCSQARDAQERMGLQNLNEQINY